MKNYIITIMFALSLQSCGQYLFEKGSTGYKIVLPDTPLPVEQTAAKELKTYLDEITDINWVIAPEQDVAEDAPQILVGNSARAKKIFPEIVPEKIPYDGIEIHLKGNKLLLTGHKQRGTLYAVNTFLEDILGVRWWTSTEQTVPTRQTFKLKPINISYAPKLIYRESHYKDAHENPLFATRIKSNGGGGFGIPPEYGGHQQIMYFVHSFHQLIPPAKYFANHPEWFSEIDGVRKHENTQLCLTNDEMRKELTKNAIEALRKSPNAKFISISQNDCFGFCTCEKCNKIAEEEGAQSGPLIWFVNAVAEDIEKEFPEVFVETLAYHYTRKPPKNIKPRNNVVVRFCTIGCSFVQPLTGEQNKAFYDDITDWSKMAKNLFVWDYVTNFAMYMLPHPNYRVLAPNIRFFVDHNTIGLFEQGDIWCPVGDFVRMRNWVISHLMWNPALDEHELIREFLTGYYGKKAAPFLREYFEALINRAESSGVHLGIYRESTDDWLDNETLFRATALFDSAIEAAKQENGAFVERLRRERMPLEVVWLFKGYNSFKQYAKRMGEKFYGPEDPVELWKSFFGMCEKYQVSAYHEGCTPEAFAVLKEMLFLRMSAKSTPAPEEFKNLHSKVWVDYQEYDIQVRDYQIWWGRSRNIPVADPAASNGRALTLSKERNVPCTQILLEDCPLFDDADTGTKYKIVVYVRCDAPKEDAPSISIAVYDNREGKTVALKQPNLSDIAGSEYTKIEFDPLPLTPDMSIRFSNTEVRDVYIDRALVIKVI